MTHYQRISPVYEAVKYEPGMEDGTIWRSPAICVSPEGVPKKYKCLELGDYILTNTATGERSVVSQKEFEREFRRVEG